MITGFFSLASRIDTAHAALLLAHAQSFEGQPVSLVRITFPGDVQLPDARDLPDTITLTEIGSTSVAEASRLVHDNIAAALMLDRQIVLDVPGSCLRDDAVRSHIDVPIICIGPTPLEEYAIAGALMRGSFATTTERVALTEPKTDAPIPVPPWLLGMGRPGGDMAYKQLAIGLKAMALAQGSAAPPRVLPLVLPHFGRAESASLLDKAPSWSAGRIGVALLSAVLACSADAYAQTLAPADVELQGDLIYLNTDHRNLGDRLRELSDVLHAIRDKTAPNSAELKAAPIVENWSRETRPAHVLVGLVYGHPEFSSGRPIVTSAIYATDGETWARTLSRFYRLGHPAAID